MTTPIEPASDDLQFDTAEPAAAAAAPRQVCAKCRQPLAGEYYAVNQHMICPACRAALDPAAGNLAGRLGLALLYGIGAGLLGALIWATVREVSGYEIGLIAVLVGFLVGKAVRKGSGNTGGVPFQVMAVLITYCGVAMSYVLIVTYYYFAHAGPLADEHYTANSAGYFTEMLYTVPAAFAAPFYDISKNVLGLLIIGFALWEAWKFNRPRKLPISGPYKLAAVPPPPLPQTPPKTMWESGV